MKAGTRQSVLPSFARGSAGPGGPQVPDGGAVQEKVSAVFLSLFTAPSPKSVWVGSDDFFKKFVFTRNGHHS